MFVTSYIETFNNFIIKEKLLRAGPKGIKYQHRRLVGQINETQKKTEVCQSHLFNSATTIHLFLNQRKLKITGVLRVISNHYDLLTYYNIDQVHEIVSDSDRIAEAINTLVKKLKEFIINVKVAQEELNTLRKKAHLKPLKAQFEFKKLLQDVNELQLHNPIRLLK